MIENDIITAGDIAAIRAQLMRNGTQFKCYGHSFKVHKTEFDRDDMDVDPLYSIGRNEMFGSSMNVKKFGPTCVTLYTYDMLGNKTVGKFRYDCITEIVE